MNISQLIISDKALLVNETSFAEIDKAFSSTELDYIAITEKSGVFLGAIYKNDFLSQTKESFNVKSLIVEKALLDYYHILETIREFLKVERCQLPVVDEEGFYLGACKLSNVQYHFNRVIGLIEGGSLLVIETSLQNYSLIEVAKIVENNQAKVLTHYISSHPDSSQIEITLVLNVSDISDILATFPRFNYQVKYSTISSEQDNLLKERFDSLMHYLDI